MSIQFGRLVSDAPSIATGIINNNRTFANSCVSTLQSIVNSIASGMSALPSTATIPDLNGLLSSIDSDISQLQGLLSTISNNISSFTVEQAPQMSASPPSPPSLSTPSSTAIDIPSFETSPPELSIPSIPDIEFPDLPAPPEITEVALPSAPTITEPTAPTLLSLSVPDPVAVEMPDAPTIPSNLEENVPELNISPVNYSEPEYTSEFKDVIVEKLEETDYGIDPAIEEQLWNRERDRLIAEYNTKVEDALKTFSLLGYRIPNGLLQQNINRIHDEFMRELSAVNRDIAIKRADLYAQARQYTIDKYVDLEKTYIALFNEVNNRTLQAMRALVESAIQIYNASVERCKLLFQAYNTYVDIYKQLIQGELAKVETYRAKIQAEGLKQEVNRSLLEAYNLQHRALENKVNLYRAMLESVSIQYQAHRTKADVYASLISAYREKINFQTAVQASYRTKVEAELAKVRVFESQVSAYNALVQSVNAKLNAEKIKFDAEIEKNRLEVSKYDMQARMFASQMDAYRTQLSAWTAGVSANTEKLRAQTTAQVEYLRTLASISSAKIEGTRALAVANIEKAKADMQTVIEGVRIKTHVGEVLSQVYGGLVQASIGATHAVAQLNDSFSTNRSDSWSQSYVEQQIAQI